MSNPEGYKGQYAHLKFPPYKFAEFPKCIYIEGKLVGTATNLLEEKEIYEAHGVEKANIDPLAAARDEIASLQEQLAAFQKGNTPEVKKPGVQSATVQMLPADLPTGGAASSQEKASNPLLKAKDPAGSPAPVGSAPKVETQIKPQV